MDREKLKYITKQILRESHLAKQIDYSNPCLLFKLSGPNAKIPHFSFSLRSGYTCPFASSCLTKIQVDPKTGKPSIERGKELKFQCYSASQELTYSTVYKSRFYNENLLKYLLKTGGSAKFAEVMINTIMQSLPRGQKIFRIHVGGDFFNKQYVDGWLAVINHFSNILFYAYTKSYPYFKDLNLPTNFRITHSLGGKYDDEIQEKGLKFATVVKSEEEAENFIWKDKLGIEHLGLEIDHDDTHAYIDDKPFALLIHGLQPKGSEMGKAVHALLRKRKRLQSKGTSAKGIGGYSRIK